MIHVYIHVEWYYASVNVMVKILYLITFQSEIRIITGQV